MLHLDYRDIRPLYAQITDNIRQQISGGVLVQGDKLPSVRELAVELSINPNTIQKAYAELERQGFIYTVKGRGNFVSGDGRLVEQRKTEYKERILDLAKEAMEIGMTKTELLREIEQL